MKILSEKSPFAIREMINMAKTHHKWSINDRRRAAVTLSMSALNDCNAERCARNAYLICARIMQQHLRREK